MVFSICCTASFADTNLNMATGYVLQPSASVLPANQLQVSGAYVASEGTNELSQLGVGPVVCHGRGENVRLLYGIGNRAEIGLGWVQIHKAIGSANAFDPSLKIKVVDQPKSNFALSLGGYIRNWNTDMRIGEEEIFSVIHPAAYGFFAPPVMVDLPIVQSMYLVMDKTWRPASKSSPTISASIGLACDHYGRTNQQFTPYYYDGGDMMPGYLDIGVVQIPGHTFYEPFVGAQVKFPCGCAILADYKTKEQSHGFDYQSATWSVAARKSIGKDLTATAGVTTFNIPYSDAKAGWFADLSYTFK